jgi:glycosyltransferase A (GT-A) superfamily protein (DUF2064 family)
MSTDPGTLVLFCKPPDRSKRRLIPALGAVAASELAERLLGCAVEDAAAWPGPVVLSPAHAADVRWAERLPIPGARVLAQAAGNLGMRLTDIDLRLRDEGHGKIVFIGSDCPQLGVDALLAAAVALDHTDVVLGRASDGGVVFMGNRSSWPALAELPWSTDALGASLAAACRARGLGVEWQGPWRDVDRPADLEPLTAALATDRRPARERLKEWLDEWFESKERSETGYP